LASFFLPTKEINMTTSKEDRDFIESVISQSLLEEAIDWIASHMSPEEVFPDSDLELWAKDNGFEDSE